MPVEVYFVEGRFPGIEGVQIRNENLKTSMRSVFEQVPFETRVVIPFGPLADFIPHEHQLFAGMGEHVSIEQAEVRERLPQVAGHFVQQGRFAVDHLIVRKRQHEVFREGVQHGERHPVVVVLSVNRVQ